MKRLLQTFLVFTKTEQRAVVALVFLCLVVLIAPKVYFYFSPAASYPVPPQVLAKLDSFEQQYAEIMQAENSEEHSFFISQKSSSTKKNPYQLAPFNPNNLDLEGWMQLGLSEKQAASILKFTSKGGRFRKPEDIQKIFVLSDEKKAELLPFVRIEAEEKIVVKEKDEAKKQYQLFPFDPNKIGIAEWLQLGLSERQANVIENYKAKGGHFYKPEDIRKIFVLDSLKKEELLPYVTIEKAAATIFEKMATAPTALVDVNVGDSAAFEQLRGIGPATAARIVAYREALGGFIFIRQLKEVYGITDSNFQRIRPQLTISKKVLLRKININSADYETLRSHPYIRGWAAKWILSYRKNAGLFKEVNYLQRVTAINDSMYEKMQPYVKVQ